MEDEPVGAWVTNHWSWYSNDYDEETRYGWYIRVEWADKNTVSEAKYYIVEFIIFKTRSYSLLK